MKRAKKRYAMMLKNDRGDWRTLDVFIHREDAEHEVEKEKRHDEYEVSIGYVDLHNEYRIDEVIIY